MTSTNSSLFKPATKSQAYLKAAFMGLAGSGKTYTASSLAIGLVKHMQAKGLREGGLPVFFVDTENGSSWMVERFREAGIELQVAQTRSFADLAQAMTIARAEASVLIIDSITAFWMEVTETYKTTKRRTRLEFSDWGWIKAEWRKRFTDRFLNDPLHVIMCGRMGFEYDHFTDEAGKKHIEKSGVKMKAEGELGFEPSLLVQMDREQDLDANAIHHVAHILKDRRPDKLSLDGKSFRNPTFATFLPHIEFLALGNEHKAAFDERATSALLVPPDERDTNSTRRTIVLEEIQAVLVEHYPSTSGADKAAKASLVEKHFRTKSWTEMERLMPLADLQSGYDALHRELKGGEPSRYGQRVAPAVTADEIPFTGETPASAPATAHEIGTAAPSPAAAPTIPPAASSEQPAGADMRDAVTERIVRAIAAAANPTRLADVLRCNAKARKELDAARNARIEAAAAERRAAMKAATVAA